MAGTFSALQQSAALYAGAASSIYAVAVAHLSEGEKTGTFPKKDSKEFNEMMGGLLGAVVLRAFSIELALKAVCVKRGVAYPKTHDLAKLFAILPSADRTAAAKGYEKKNPTSKGGLEGLLKANANTIEEWRYQHEYIPQKIAYEELAIAFDEIYALSK
jgi:hypothetical protein